MGRAGFPPCFFTWDQIMVEVLKIMVTSFKRPCACTAALSAPDPAAATTDPCLHQRLLDTHGQVWISFLWGHCSFLLGHGTHKVLFVPSKSLFPSGGSVVGLMATSFKNLCHTQVCCIQSPCPCGRPLVTHTSAGDTQTFKGRTDSLYGFSGCTPGFVSALWTSLASMRFDSKCNFALPTIFLGLLLCLGCGVSFLGGDGDGCSAASCNGVLAGEDEWTSFYSTILYFYC